MSTHVLNLTIIGAHFDTIEAEVVERVKAYTRWDTEQATDWVNRHANIEVEPIARRPRIGVVYRATVRIGV